MNSIDFLEHPTTIDSQTDTDTDIVHVDDDGVVYRRSDVNITPEEHRRHVLGLTRIENEIDNKPYSGLTYEQVAGRLGLNDTLVYFGLNQ